MFFFILLKRQLYESEEFPVIRSDNGPQFISNLFEGTCVELNIEHERIPFKTPNDIGAFWESQHYFDSQSGVFKLDRPFWKWNYGRRLDWQGYLPLAYAPYECQGFLSIGTDDIKRKKGLKIMNRVIVTDEPIYDDACWHLSRSWKPMSSSELFWVTPKILRLWYLNWGRR